MKNRARHGRRSDNHRNAGVVQNHGLFQLIVDSIEDYSIVALSPEGNVLSWNTGVSSLNGYSSDEVVGRHFSLFYSVADNLDGKPLRALEIARSEGRYHDEGWRSRKDGSRFWASVIITPMSDSSRSLIVYSKVTHGITESMQAEALLAECQAQLALATESAQIGIWEWDVPANHAVWDAQMCSIYGIRAEEFRGAHDAWGKGVHPEDQQRVSEEIRDVLHGSEDFHTQFRVVWPDGKVRHIEAHAIVQRALDGSPLRVIGVCWDITPRREAEVALREAHAEFERTVTQRATEFAHFELDLQRTIDNVPALIGYWGSDLRNRFANQAYKAWFGLTPAEIKGKHIREVIGEALFAESYPYLQAVLKGEVQFFERTVTDKVGSVHYTQTSYVPDFREGHVQGLHVLITDITQRKQAELALFAEKERARVTLNSIGDGVITTDTNGLVTYVNPIAEEMTGWSIDLAIGVPIEQIMIIRDGTTGEPMTSPIRLALQQGRIVELVGNCVLKSRHRTEFHIEDSGAPIRDNSGAVIGAVIVFHDVTEARAMTRKLSYLAHHDILTNLPNRLLLRDRLTQVIQFSKRTHMSFALLVLDLDHFKNVNDSLGHSTGDDLLKAVANRLTSAVREMDTVSRQGGDEFIVLLAQVDSPEHTGDFAQKLLDIIAEPYELGNERVTVTCSIGISVSPEDGEDSDTLMRYADAAMYSAKRAGRNRYHFFSRAIDEAVMRRHTLERDIREGLEASEFSVYYQLKVDSVTNRAIGNEALVRWHRPGGEVVSPIHFIPVAEESGLIVPLGKFVLKEACRQNQEWQMAGIPPVPIAVNFSGAQIKDADFVPMVERVLLETGMAPEHLELEITESTLIETAEDAVPVLDKLRAMGVRIALDDFGTGYSSLSHLRHLPVDTLKIDRSFVTDLLENANDNAIVSAIIGIGRGLGLEVIAEGVETEEQAAYLRSLQCPLMQGYLFSRPLPGEQATKVLESRAV